MSVLELENTLSRIKRYQRVAEKINLVLNQLQARITQHMEQQQMEELHTGKHNVAWRETYSAQFDCNALRKEMPQIYQRYSKTKTVKKFLLTSVE